MKRTVLVTGADGFLGRYIVEELVQNGWYVYGLDNCSKYECKGAMRIYNYELIKGDAKDISLVSSILSRCDHMIAGAAMIGGIGYINNLAYTLLAENERITATACDAAIQCYKNSMLKKITMISSSMVFENCRQFPTKEGSQFASPPPMSAYGFQKLANEYFVKAARDQFGIPFTIIRPFNCYGRGEQRSVQTGGHSISNHQYGTRHVIPDIIHKLLNNQMPLKLYGDGNQVRCYTYAGDAARAIRLSLENPDSANEDFNISSTESFTVRELAHMVWKKICPEKPIEIQFEKGFAYDVQKRIPNTSKAEQILGFRAMSHLSEKIDEIIDELENEHYGSSDCIE